MASRIKKIDVPSSRKASQRTTQGKGIKERRIDKRLLLEESIINKEKGKKKEIRDRKEKRIPTEEIVGLTETQELKAEIYKKLIENGEYPPISPGYAINITHRISLKYAKNRKLKEFGLDAEKELEEKKKNVEEKGKEIDKKFIGVVYGKIMSAISEITGVYSRTEEKLKAVRKDMEERISFWNRFKINFGFKSVITRVGGFLTAIGITTVHFTNYLHNLGSHSVLLAALSGVLLYGLFEGVLQGLAGVMKRRARRIYLKRKEKVIQEAKEKKKKILLNLGKTILITCKYEYPKFYAIAINGWGKELTEREKRAKVMEKLERDHKSDFTIPIDINSNGF